MKKQLLLNFVWATIVVVLLFYIRTSAEIQDQPLITPDSEPSATCRYDAIGGFSQGAVVERTVARDQSNAYVEFANRQNSNIYGGVISKAALDSLLCGGNYNGLAYRLAMDSTGKHGPANAVFIIVGGVNVQNGSIVSQSNNYYTNNLWCPTNCMNFE